jgi:4-amino-4-deoxychorismate lyase
VTDLPSEHCVPFSDRGLNYGDGLFETMRIWDRRIPLLARHLDRLVDGLRRLAFTGPDRDDLEACVARVVNGANAESGVVKVLVTRGDGGRGYAPPESASPRILATLHALPEQPAHAKTRGIRAGRCRTVLGRSPALAGLKHLGRLEQVLGAAEVRRAGWHEGVMCDEHGSVVEGTRSNLFLARDGVLITPELDASGVAGILRGRILERVSAAGEALEIRRVDYHELMTADEVFFANSVAGLWPVAALGPARWQDFPVCHRLAAALAAEGLAWLA